MTGFDEKFPPFAEKMKAEDLPDIFIDTFAHYYDMLLRGETGLIPESEIEPIDELPDLEALDSGYTKAGEEARSRTVAIKVNGGLGTSMGLEKAKSLLPVRDGLSFLDAIARQAIHAGTPLVLMNSFATEEDSLRALERYPELKGAVPLSFRQHKEPKVTQEDLAPASWPQNPALEWCPPGHGDIYTALVTSGMLDALLEAGYQYAFVSNADNLGAVVDTSLLGYMAERELPFLSEAADRTETDKKGGHLARRSDGGWVLRESAQCPEEDQEAFQDIRRHRYFNTNNLWLDLKQLERVMAERNNRLGLPLIRNAKTVDPRDPSSPAVYQLETAMGAAIAVFPGAEAVRVPRSRFAPVKTTNELLAVRSDAYVLTDSFQISMSPKRTLGPLSVVLDGSHYKLISDLEARFPHGPPSLLACERFDVRGDFRFGKEVVARGDVRLVNESERQVALGDGALLEGELRFQ